jgi:hypothetical protein
MDEKLDNIELPNITYKLRRHELGRYDGYKLMLHPQLVPLIKKLALKKPNWTFCCECEQEKRNEDTLVFEEVRIIENNRDAGSIATGTKWRRRGGTVTIKKERGPSNTITTTKEDVAFKTALKKFGAKDDGTVLKEKVKEAQGIFNMVSTNHSYFTIYSRGLTQSNDKVTMCNSMINFIQDNEKAFLKQLPVGLQPTYNALMDNKQKAEVVNTVGSWKAAKKDITVYIDNDKWRVYNLAGTCDHWTFDSDSDAIPDHVKRKVGILKLVENQHVVANVGLRIDETLFVITPAEAPENE